MIPESPTLLHSFSGFESIASHPNGGGPRENFHPGSSIHTDGVSLGLDDGAFGGEDGSIVGDPDGKVDIEYVGLVDGTVVLYLDPPQVQHASLTVFEKFSNSFSASVAHQSVFDPIS